MVIDTHPDVNCLVLDINQISVLMSPIGWDCSPMEPSLELGYAIYREEKFPQEKFVVVCFAKAPNPHHLFGRHWRVRHQSQPPEWRRRIGEKTSTGSHASGCETRDHSQ